MPNSRIARDLRDVTNSLARAAEAAKSYVHPHKTRHSNDPGRERMSEREFVRMFGDKVKKVRYSGRADFVGLLLLGKEQGFIVTTDTNHRRKIRLIDVVDGKTHITHRFLALKENDSMSNLQRGLLKWVR